jgi:hypothetical protein
MATDAEQGFKYMLYIAFAVIFLVAFGMWGCPQYDVYKQGLGGEASLARAEQDRQILIQEAKAKKESAVLLAEAEVLRAKGVAEANKIIAEGLGGPEGYLRYIWIQALSENDSDVIYIPTEAGMPILEAGRLNKLEPEHFLRDVK